MLTQQTLDQLWDFEHPGHFGNTIPDRDLQQWAGRVGTPRQQELARAAMKAC